jgi:hypothetical protein
MPAEAMNSNDRALRFATAIMATRETEIDCERFQSVVAQYVDLEVSGGDPGQLEDGLPLHARMCPECAELYRALLHVSRLEHDGAMPNADEMWAELARLATPGVGLAALSVHAGSVTSVVPAASAAAVTFGTTPPQPTAGRAGHRSAGRTRFRLPSWTSRPAFGMAAMTAAVMIAFAGLAMREGGTSSGSGANSLVRQAPVEGGGTVSVSFSPESEQFTITSADTRTPLRRLQCWLVDQEGARQEARLNWEREAESWTGWVDRPMRDFVLLSLIRMPEESEVARISLR